MPVMLSCVSAGLYISTHCLPLQTSTRLEPVRSSPAYVETSLITWLRAHATAEIQIAARCMVLWCLLFVARGAKISQSVCQWTPAARSC